MPRKRPIMTHRARSITSNSYPHGPARNPTSVQRGSVQFISIYPGDPTTPGYPSYENSTRLNATSIPSIPSLPISWANAQILLQEIEGKNRVVKLTNHGALYFIASGIQSYPLSPQSTPRLGPSGIPSVLYLVISRMRSYSLAIIEMVSVETQNFCCY
jgi:hypothetical protein